jgi:cardiolipin synthase
METAVEKDAATPGGQLPLPAQDKHAGTVSGVNIAPGDHDDGWIVTQPIHLADGTRVQLYKDGEALHAAFEAIRHARLRICLEVYIFADDPTGRAFADLLSEKARQGVKVFVIYDSFGSIQTDRDMFHQMRRAGVRIEEFHPLRPWEGRFSWRPFTRDHRKLLLVDDDIAGMGGLNVASEYAGSWVVKADKPCDAWRDTSIGLVGPAARLFLHSFVNTWQYINHGGRLRRAEFLHGIQDPRKPRVARPRLSRGTRRKGERESELLPDLGILASVASMDSPLRPLLHRVFREAKKSIQMTMAYFAPDDELIASLCGAARRGVKVQLMLPGQCDVKPLLTAARSFYTTLMEAGVEVYERQGCILHAKTNVIDGCISIVGSTNLDYRSIEYNCELSAAIRNSQFGEQMQKLFANDVGFAKKISLREWRKRPFVDRAIQWTVNRVRYLL